MPVFTVSSFSPLPSSSSSLLSVGPQADERPGGLHIYVWYALSGLGALVLAIIGVALLSPPGRQFLRWLGCLRPSPGQLRRRAAGIVGLAITASRREPPPAEPHGPPEEQYELWAQAADLFREAERRERETWGEYWGVLGGVEGGGGGCLDGGEDLRGGVWVLCGGGGEGGGEGGEVGGGVGEGGVGGVGAWRGAVRGGRRAETEAPILIHYPYLIFMPPILNPNRGPALPWRWGSALGRPNGPHQCLLEPAKARGTKKWKTRKSQVAYPKLLQSQDLFTRPASAKASSQQRSENEENEREEKEKTHRSQVAYPAVLQSQYLFTRLLPTATFSRHRREGGERREMESAQISSRQSYTIAIITCLRTASINSRFQQTTITNEAEDKVAETNPTYRSEAASSTILDRLKQTIDGNAR